MSKSCSTWPGSGMLTVLTHCSWITGRDLHALGVEFVYPDPPDPGLHCEAFQCPLRFGQGANRALLSTADLALPLSGRNATLATLHISSRTLQRRLEDEGTSFQQLRDDTRRELAQRYLREPVSSSLSRVAELLGFEDQSNLFRACKRWFGESPGQYRARFGARQLAMPAAPPTRDAMSSRIAPKASLNP